MSELVANCPRCGAQKITFALLSDVPLRLHYNWKHRYEAFCVCRNCMRTTTFVLAQKSIEDKKYVNNGLTQLAGTVNQYMNIEGYVGHKNLNTNQPPEHVPDAISKCFREGSACYGIECYNAAAAMFRLCVDLATRPMLPKEEAPGLNSRVRRDLGLRLPWLFENKKLPDDLNELASCIKDDGNDGVHRGTLAKEDAEDLLDFTVALLRRLYTEPERLKIAEKRRENRRKTD